MEKQSKLEIKKSSVIKNEHDNVLCFILLSDNRLAVSSHDSYGNYLSEINILNSTDFKIESTIKNSDYHIFSILEIKPNVLASCGFGGDIKIWDISQKEASLIKTIEGAHHEGNIKSLISVNENTFLSSSDDNTLKVWNKNDFSLKKTIKVDYIPNKLLDLGNGKILILYPTIDDNTSLFEIRDTNEDFKIIYSKKGHDINSAFYIEEEKIILGGYEEIILFNMKKLSIERVIKNKEFCPIYSGLILDDGNILVSNSKGNIFLIKKKEYTSEIILKIKASRVNMILLEDNNILMAGDDDGCGVFIKMVNYIA